MELIRRWLNEWNRGAVNESSIRATYHPDGEFLPLRSATEGAYHGIAGIESFIADTQEVFDKADVRYELRDLGERVLAWGTLHVRAKQSGIETDIPTGGVFEFRDGKIVRWEDYGSKDKALKAVGLAESEMSQESVELVRSISAAHERGDYGSAEWAHPEIEYVIVGGLTPGSWKGRAAMAKAAGELFSTSDEHRTVVEEVRPLDGERVLVLCHTSGRFKASGIELDAAQRQIAELYQVRDGNVIRHVVYFDRADALAELGLAE